MRVHCELALEKKTHSLVCSTWAKISFFSLKLASHKTTPHQPHQPQNKLSSLLWTQSQETKPLKTDKSPRKHYFLKENKLHTTLGSDNSVPWRIWVPWRQQGTGRRGSNTEFCYKLQQLLQQAVRPGEVWQVRNSSSQEKLSVAAPATHKH